MFMNNILSILFFIIFLIFVKFQELLPLDRVLFVVQNHSESYVFCIYLLPCLIGSGDNNVKF